MSNENKYAGEAISQIKNFIQKTFEHRKVGRLSQAEVKEFNLQKINKYRRDCYGFRDEFFCMCYGCRQRFSPNFLDEDQPQIKERIEKGKLFCPHCTENGSSKSFLKLLQAFPRAFIVGDNATDESRLPQETFRKVSEWAEREIIKGDCFNSLYVCGQTGTGKSRIATLVALRCLEYGVTINCIRGGQFAQHLRGFQENDSKGESAWLDNLKRSNVLIFDDFGRDNLTPTMFEKLWGVLDTRLGNRTTIFLSNFTPDKNPSLDESLVRRVADFCSYLEV